MSNYTNSDSNILVGPLVKSALFDPFAQVSNAELLTKKLFASSRRQR